ncbi:GEVED domain-containing protein [Capnocytophaga sp. ARDL2]|uniref:GEVED domain-containing protein n=1 Tax=Capnocytophaga sp. ARDL2 TaxID=3238809 RepID=UPI00355852C4
MGFNNDGEFEETEIIANAFSGISLSDSDDHILIPADTSAGTYRLRIATQYVGAPQPCDNEGGYGEAQDYTFTLLAAPNCISPNTFSMQERTDTTFTLGWNGNTSSYLIKIDAVNNESSTLKFIKK